MAQYGINFKNDSIDGTFCIYQTHDEMNPDTYKSLAWFTQDIANGGESYYQWNIDYCFVWAASGILKPGVTFQSSQKVTADLNTANDIIFSKMGNSYSFSKPGINNNHDCFTIHQDPPFQEGKASIGIGMSGTGTFAMNAHQNMTAKFKPHPRYWVVFGEFKLGEVMDMSNTTTAKEIMFEGSHTLANVTLDANNILQVEY